MDGGDRAGYMQISRGVAADIITDTMGAQTGVWTRLEVLSTQIQLVGITAPGLSMSSLIDSDTTYENGQVIACDRITSIQVSAKCTDGRVIAYQKAVY